MSNIDWDNAPVTATHYGGGKFWRMHDSGNCWETECAFQWVFSNESPMAFIDYCRRPQTHTEQRESDDKPDWSKAPKGATHYGDGRYWMNSSFGLVPVWSWYDKFSNRCKASNESPVGHHDFTLIPQTKQNAPAIAHDAFLQQVDTQAALTAKSVLESGLRILTERGQQYGSGERECSFPQVAQAFNAITGRDLAGSDVCLLLALVKQVRQYAQPGRFHEDSAVDGVNYFALQAEQLKRERSK